MSHFTIVRRDIYLFEVALMVFEPYLHSCILTEKVNFAILWTPGVLSIQPCPPGLGADVA